MDLTILAIIVGAIVGLISIIVSIVTFRRKSRSVDISFPKNSKNSQINISKGKIGQNIVVGNDNTVNVRNRLSDTEIKNLVDNISVKDQSRESKKIDHSSANIQKRKSKRKE